MTNMIRRLDCSWPTVPLSVAATLAAAIALAPASTAAQTPVRCDTRITPISAIQGSGNQTPLSAPVVTRGIVVGDFEGPPPALGGFYMQDPIGDGDVATSDGIFVFTDGDDWVALGDEVVVQGKPGESMGETRIVADRLAKCGAGTVQPTMVTLPLPSADFPERFEGMLVRIPERLFVTEHYQLGRFGQILVSGGGRLIQPTVVARGDAAVRLQAMNDLNQLVVDDGRNAQNPAIIELGRGGRPLSSSNTLRAGDVVTGATGVMTWGWGGHNASPPTWRLRTGPMTAGGMVDFQPANGRSDPPDRAGSLRVSAFNVLNFFNTFEGCRSGVTGPEMDCRGAGSADEFTRQRAKIVAAIAAMKPDILGLMEIENDGYGPASAIADLAREVSSAAGVMYELVDVDAATKQPDALGSDAIKVGMLYRSDVVRPVGRTAALNGVEFVEAGEGEPRSRPSLAQAFETRDGERLVVAVNHLKSKGSPCNADSGDEPLAGNCNDVRARSAALLARWLLSDPTGAATPRILLVGDLNSYAEEDPILALREAGFRNLVSRFAGPDAYSYGFAGQWGYLDYALGTPTIEDAVRGVSIWHINADEPPVLDYNTDFKTPEQVESLFSPDPWRSGDHDPVIVDLDL